MSLFYEEFKEVYEGGRITRLRSGLLFSKSDQTFIILSFVYLNGGVFLVLKDQRHCSFLQSGFFTVTVFIIDRRLTSTKLLYVNLLWYF